VLKYTQNENEIVRGMRKKREGKQIADLNEKGALKMNRI